MSIKKEKNGTYTVRFWKDGKGHTKRGFDTKNEALNFENKVRNKEVDTCFIKFHDFVEEYREYYKKTVTYSTYLRTGVFWETYILPNFPNKSINSITSIECLRFWEKIESLDKSTGYKNDIIGTLKGAFKYAMKYHQLKEDPTSTLDRYKKTREEKLNKKNKDLRVWDVSEFKKFIEKVDSQMFKMLFKVLYLTGMRKGEALALTWEDLLDHKISINKSLSRKTEGENSFEIKDPKTVGSIRDIAINDTLYQELLIYKQNEMRIPGFEETWYMFGRTKPIAENTLTRVKDRAVELAGVKRICIHELRHSHASNLIASGMNIVSVSKRLGHTDVSMTLSIYTHLINDDNDNKLINDIERINQEIIDNSGDDEEHKN